MNSAIKGTAFINLKLFIDSKIGSENTTAFLAQQVGNWPFPLVPSSWYSLDIYMKAESELAIKTGISSKEAIIASALHSLETDLNGIYKFFMKLGGVERVLGAGGSMAKTYMNFVTQETIENKKGVFKAHAMLPEKYADWYLAKTEGAFEGILKVFGLKKIAFNFIDKRLYDENGVQYADVAYEIFY